MLTRTPVLLGGVMIIEAAVLFAGFKFIGAGTPQAAAGAEILAPETSDHEPADAEGHGPAGAGAAPAGTDRKRPIELPLLEFRAPNKQSGRTFIYDVSIFVITRGEFEERVKATINDRKALIQDRVRTIIAQCDPEKLGGGSEPGLETLRRQVRHQLEEIIGEGMIQEVLVPRCIPFRTDY
jgi:flagellar basal body-associated protein FliL